MTATATATATATCATCELGLEHCHALLVEHGDGTASCLEGCGGPRAVHDEVVACADVGQGCCAAEAVATGGPAPVAVRAAA